MPACLGMLYRLFDSFSSLVRKPWIRIGRKETCGAVSGMLPVEGVAAAFTAGRHTGLCRPSLSWSLSQSFQEVLVGRAILRKHSSVIMTCGEDGAVIPNLFSFLLQAVEDCLGSHQKDMMCLAVFSGHTQMTVASLEKRDVH